MKYLTHDQVAKLLEVYQDLERRLLLRCLYFTGCRISELLALRPAAIEWQNRVLVLPALKVKKKTDKRVVVDAETLAMLKAFIKARTVKADEPVFSMTRWQAWKAVKEAGEKTGAPWIHPHTLRHSFAIHWAQAGANLVKLQRQLGHTKFSTTTDMYLEFATEDIREDYDERVFRRKGGFRKVDTPGAARP